MTTTTQGIPIYFPSKPRKKIKYRFDPEQRFKKGECTMRAAKLGVKLVEHGLSPRKALEALIEMDPDKAAELMAANIKDPDERKRAEMRFKKEVVGMIQGQAEKAYGEDPEEPEKEGEEGEDPEKEEDDDPEEDDDNPSVAATSNEDDDEPEDDEEEDPEDPEEDDDPDDPRRSPKR